MRTSLNQAGHSWPLPWQSSSRSLRQKVSRVSIHARAHALPRQIDILTVNSEHLVKIRNFIKIRKESDIVTDGKFFDSVCFWQKAHEESQEEQTKLLNTIYELEQHNQTLLSKVNKEFLGGENKNRSSTKRKVGGAGLTLGGSEAGKKTSRARLTKNKPETMDDQVERERGH